MTRAIIRVSLEGTGPAQVKIAKTLERHGFVKTGTATHEATLSSTGAAYDAVRALLDTLDQVNVKFPLDHLWLYLSK